MSEEDKDDLKEAIKVVDANIEARIETLEKDDANDEKTIKTISVSMIGLQNASLKHTVALSLFLAVLLFIASRALGA